MAAQEWMIWLKLPSVETTGPDCAADPRSVYVYIVLQLSCRFFIDSYERGTNIADLFELKHPLTYYCQYDGLHNHRHGNCIWLMCVVQLGVGSRQNLLRVGLIYAPLGHCLLKLFKWTITTAHQARCLKHFYRAAYLQIFMYFSLSADQYRQPQVNYIDYMNKMLKRLF